MAVKHRRYTRFGEYDTYFENAWVSQNPYITAPPVVLPLPSLDAVKGLLPDPFWEGHESVIACYWKVWELAFRHLGNPTEANEFAAPYIDTAFWAPAIFMWDTSFIMMFTRYGRRAFPFQLTLDTFYAKQHPDGFISRQIRYTDGEDTFFRFDPVSTGPNLLPWAEWEYFRDAGDKDRLARVFPALMAYHQWLRRYRTWQDGSYWTTGWGCGMDNQPRVPGTTDAELWMEHAHQVWLDACLQQILSARLLTQMADVLGKSGACEDMQAEADALTKYVNQFMWDDQNAFYYDLDRHRNRLKVKSIGAYWALLAKTLSPEQAARFVAHLSDPAEFNRPHRIPSLSADDPAYDPNGGYWRGGVWDPTNTMVLRGLDEYGFDALAHEIGLNHVLNVAQVFAKTGTVWENYGADNAPNPGNQAKDNFVGWGGVGPVAIFLESVLGLRSNVPENTLTWTILLTDDHGVRRYPFGEDGWVDVHCARRQSAEERPQITLKSSVPLTLLVRWQGGEARYSVKG
ncbi:MAG: trehalase family glycosidase [Anaerolineae bacterium]